MEQFVIKNIKYNVVSCKTLEDLEAENHTLLATQFRKIGWAKMYYLKRPNGKTIYLANYHQRGFWSKVVSLKEE